MPIVFVALSIADLIADSFCGPESAESCVSTLDAQLEISCATPSSFEMLSLSLSGRSGSAFRSCVIAPSADCSTDFTCWTTESSVEATPPSRLTSMCAAAVPAWVEEALRYDTSSQILARTAVTDIELHDEVKPLIESEALRALDVDLAKWFMMLIHRRLRSGTVKADVALLAGRVAASFDGTPEGASLRASLPTLRRAAGLCARCAQPYTGIADACPACLTGASPPNAQSAALPPVTTEPEPAEET